MNNLGFKYDVPSAWRVPSNFQLTPHTSKKKNINILLENLAFFVSDALSITDCKLLRELFAKQTCTPVGVSGYQTAGSNEVGSQRATGWGPELSKQLWEKIYDPVSNIFNFSYSLSSRIAIMDKTTPTDWYGLPDKRKEHKLWIPTGISPVLRFMEYKSGGKHHTHYDMGYDYETINPQDKRRTLLSVVWYLNDESNDTGGCTRFINDGQQDIPIFNRNMDDWAREARDDEVIAMQKPCQGGALLFWHRMPHDVQKFTGNSRIIIRGDIEFTALD